MGDNEIIKALIECANNGYNENCRSCKNCPYLEMSYLPEECMTMLAKDALDLINRLQAENERVETLNSDLVEIQDIRKKVNLALIAENAELTTAYKTAKSEAYKEFAEMIYKTTWYHINKNGELVQGANSETDIPLYKAKDVHNLLKELVGEDK